jgi:hypothetical protein
MGRNSAYLVTLAVSQDSDHETLVFWVISGLFTLTKNRKTLFDFFLCASLPIVRDSLHQNLFGIISANYQNKLFFAPSRL